jgi:hypothetical protein
MAFLKRSKLPATERASARLFRSDMETIDRAIEGPRKPTFLVWKRTGTESFRGTFNWHVAARRHTQGHHTDVYYLSRTPSGRLQLECSTLSSRKTIGLVPCGNHTDDAELQARLGTLLVHVTRLVDKTVG